MLLISFSLEHQIWHVEALNNASIIDRKGVFSTTHLYTLEHSPCLLDEQFQKRLIDGSVHVDARSAEADLARVYEGSPDQGRNGFLQVSVSEHYGSVLAAHLATLRKILLSILRQNS